MLGVLGAGAAAAPAYASGVHTGTHHGVRARAGSKTCKTSKTGSKATKASSKSAKKTAVAIPARPWLYIATAVPNRPWLYAPAVTGTRPWLYATSDKVACKSGAAPVVRKAAAAKAAAATAHGAPVATVAG